jgi:uracil-DNA glycosylase family 4
MSVTANRYSSFGLEQLEQEALSCTRCRLASSRTNVVFGVGKRDADLMLIGEAPGYHEDQKGEPFVGPAGQLLDRLLLEEAGISRSEVYIANVLKCRPPNNRDPRDDEVDACKDFLLRQIELVRPLVIATLGNFATKLLLGRTVGISRLRGQTFPFGDGYVVIPTYHPAALLRGTSPQRLAEARSDFRLVAEQLRQMQRARSAEADGQARDPRKTGGTQASQLGLFS